MKLIFFIALLAIVGLSSQITAQEFLIATNKARVNPEYYANLIKTQFTSKGILGKTGDPNCYAEAEAFLMGRAPIPLYTENIVADCAAKNHSDWMNSTGTLSHKGEGGSNTKIRLDMFGVWSSKSYGYNENIAYSTTPGRDAETFTLKWITDCGTASRGHRTNIFSIKVDQYGCGQTGFYVTCVGSKAINSKATDAELERFSLSQAVNGAGFTGF